jgi:hypothetical protein
MSELGRQLWCLYLGGGFSVALTVQNAVKVASKLVIAQKVPCVQNKKRSLSRSSFACCSASRLKSSGVSFALYHDARETNAHTIFRRTRTRSSIRRYNVIPK